MQLLLDDRQLALSDQGRALGDGLPPDGDPALAEATLTAARAAGLALLTVPEDRGGAGLSLFDSCLFLEGLARSRPSAASTLAAHALLVGAEVAGSVDGDVILAALQSHRTGAFAYTEPGGARRPADLQTVARTVGHEVRLSGEKAYVTNGGAWAMVLVVARVEGEGAPALFAVDGDAAGIEWRPLRGSVGLLGTRVADLVLHDVVALRRLDGGGGGSFEAALLRDRTAIAAQAVGVAMEALQETLRHISTRETMGRPMQRNGTVQAQVADMAAALDGARLLWWQAACAIDAGAAGRDLSAMAKLHAARAARLVTDGCLQLLGGAGCFGEGPAARRVGAARLASIRGGPDELMRAVTAREFLDRLQRIGMLT